MLSAETISFQKKISALGLQIPRAQVVLGSGFGNALEEAANYPGWNLVGDISFRDIGIVSSTAPDHAGKYRLFSRGNNSVIFQMGRLHGYEGNSPKAVTAPVMVPRLAGVENFLLTNAAGGLMAEYRPGDVMIIRDHVNLTGQNPLSGENPKRADGQDIGPRFPDMSNAYDQAWRNRIREELKGMRVHEGTYLGVAGPSFETPAEVSLFSRWGMQAVGMSTVWETIALCHSGARVAGLSLISNAGAGMSDEKLDHFVILDTCRAAAAKIVRGLFSAMEKELKL